MTIEITKEAFNAILGDNNTKACQRIKTTEPARFIRYYANGVNLQSVENFVSCVTQYYVMIAEAQAEFDSFIAEGDTEGAEQICSDWFGLEPDYLIELF